MQYRELGRTGWKVSAISFGSWAIGGTWGQVDDADSLAALHRAIELGVNFFDTADVYGDGRSERLLAQLRRQHGDKIHIATKAGRRLDPHVAKATTGQILPLLWSAVSRTWIQKPWICFSSTARLPRFTTCRRSLACWKTWSKRARLRYYGVSVEKVEEALKAIEYPNVQSVQIIFNMFRQRPAELFFEQTKKRKVGILARVPLASGMLTGKLKPDNTFAPDDHRTFNRHGEAFDRGETFSGVDYETGLQAVEELKAICPAGMSMGQFALRWILMFDAVTCAIPGAKRPAQVDENFTAADLAPLSAETMSQVKSIYDRRIRELVHHYW